VFAQSRKTDRRRAMADRLRDYLEE
jgi:hypothetical protein